MASTARFRGAYRGLLRPRLREEREHLVLRATLRRLGWRVGEEPAGQAVALGARHATRRARGREGGLGPLRVLREVGRVDVAVGIELAEGRCRSGEAFGAGVHPPRPGVTVSLEEGESGPRRGQ